MLRAGCDVAADTGDREALQEHGRTGSWLCGNFQSTKCHVVDAEVERRTGIKRVKPNALLVSLKCSTSRGVVSEKNSFTQYASTSLSTFAKTSAFNAQWGWKSCPTVNVCYLLD